VSIGLPGLSFFEQAFAKESSEVAQQDEDFPQVYHLRSMCLLSPIDQQKTRGLSQKNARDAEGSDAS